jgi:hypothetical protein
MSYPKNADGTYNTNAEIIGIGRVASGLLLPKYADENFLEFESDVFEATKLYANNYNQLAGQYKNLNTFKSVKDFVNFNLNNSEIEVNTIDKKVKKTPDEKLQALIDQQFPSLSLQDLKEIADLDSETEIETGKIGAFSKTVLLPVYLRATEEEKHNIKKNKAILNKICNKFDLISNGKIKRELQDAASKATCLSDLMKIFDIKV